MLPAYFALCCCHTSMTHSVRALTLHRRSSSHSKHMIGALGAKWQYHSDHSVCLWLLGSLTCLWLTVNVLVVGFVQRFINSQFYWMTTLLQHQIKEENLLLWMLRFTVLVSVFESVLSTLLTHEKSNMVFLTDMSYCILFTFSVMLADTPISSLVLLQM